MEGESNSIECYERDIKSVIIGGNGDRDRVKAFSVRIWKPKQQQNL